MEKINSMEDLVKVVDSNPILREKIPDNLVRSYPVPIYLKRDLFIAFMFFGKGGASPEPPRLSTPRYRMVVNPQTGEIVELVRVKPADFHIDWPEGKPIGVHNLAPEITMEIFRAKRKQLFKLYDKILPLYRTTKVNLAPQERQLVSDFYQVFNELVEKPLLPFYNVLNPDFFSWLERFGIKK